MLLYDVFQQQGYFLGTRWRDTVTLGVWFRQNDLEHFGSFMTDAEEFFYSGKKPWHMALVYSGRNHVSREGFVSFLINWSLKLILYYLFCQYIHYTSDVFFCFYIFLLRPFPCSLKCFFVLRQSSVTEGQVKPKTISSQKKSFLEGLFVVKGGCWDLIRPHSKRN